MIYEKQSNNQSWTQLLLFLGLKLANVIDWPWIWVLSPLWISAIGVVIALVVYVLVNEPHKPRKAVWCRECRYKGCICSSGFLGPQIHCTKLNKNVPMDHYCLEGEKREKVKK